MNRIKHIVKNNAGKVKASASTVTNKLGKAGKRGQAEILDDVPVPRITNETVAEHREEILGSARKYIYPLQHSKHRIVVITSGLVIVAVVSFFAYCMLALYKLQSTSSFLYRVTQVLPFPVARTGSTFVSYENYLFDLRHYMHYYEEQQKLSFDSESGKAQLNEYKKRALERVINNAYIKRVAKQNNITVTDQEVSAEIDILRKQDRLGETEKVFEDVLKDYWGWSIEDFRRSVKQEILNQKVLAFWDTETRQRAEVAQAEIAAGKDFAAVAKQYSDDVATKEQGGDLGIWIEQSNRDVSAKTISTLFSLQPGQTSEIIDIGYALEIVKLLELKDGNARAANGYVLDVDRRDPLATGLDHVLRTVRDLHEAQLVHGCDVPGIEPATLIENGGRTVAPAFTLEI